MGSYKVGMRIPVAYGATAVERFGSVGSEMGYLTLPHPGANGRCQFGTEVQYWKDAEGVACVQAGSVADLCKPASVLAADRLVKDLFVAKQVGGKEEWSNIAKWTPVTLQVSLPLSHSPTLSIYLSIYLSTYLLSIYLLIYLSIYRERARAREYTYIANLLYLRGRCR